MPINQPARVHSDRLFALSGGRTKHIQLQKVMIGIPTIRSPNHIPDIVRHQGLAQVHLHHTTRLSGGTGYGPDAEFLGIVVIVSPGIQLRLASVV